MGVTIGVYDARIKLKCLKCKMLTIILLVNIFILDLLANPFIGTDYFLT